MKKLCYNRLVSAQIKGAVGSLIVISGSISFTYITDGLPENQVTLYHVLTFYLVLSAVVYTLSHLPFGRMMETCEKKRFSTYFNVLGIKIRERKWGVAKEVSLWQDQQKYYCIQIKTADGETFQPERYPTLKQADARLDEFRQLFA